MADTQRLVRPLMVDKNPDGSLTLKREGGGPFFTLYPDEVVDIKASKYDPPKK